MALESSGLSALPEEPVPTELNTAAQGHSLEVLRDKLTVRYTGEGRHNSDVGAIQANYPVPQRRVVYYFEITVLDQGEHGRIAIGFATKDFKLTRQPGWEPNSYGYHGDDGKKFGASGKGEDYGPTYGTGDTIGAGIHLAKQEIFFTKNGTKLRTAFRNIKSGLLPTLGLHSKGEMVQVNFGQKPFRFDLEGMISDERAAHQAAVERIPISPGLTHHVVRKYLLHYGYADTLRAFDQAAGMGSCAEEEEGAATSMAVDGPETNDARGADSSGAGCSGAGVASAGHSGGGATSSTSTRGEDAAKDSDSDGEEHKESQTLQVRQDVRKAVLAGDVDTAIAHIRTRFPLLLQEGSGYAELQFHLNAQKYIELVRAGAIQEAVAFAQVSLAGIRQAQTHLEPALRDVVAVIAYEQPESSPLAHLLSVAQRERVADAANAAILTFVSGKGPSYQPVSVVERVLRQLVVVHAMLLELNGNQGEVFKLQDHLLPRNQHTG